MSLKHALSGAAGRKLVILEWIAAVAVLTAVGYGGFEAFSRAPEQPEQAIGAVQGQEDAIVRRCLTGDEGPDEVTFDPAWNCYRLGAGPDHLDAAEAREGLLVDISETPTSGRIATGQGDDVITSGQWGEIRSGGGDDDIALLLSVPGGDKTSVFIDPGPGDDFIDLVAAPGLHMTGKVLAGEGSVKANLVCQSGMIDVAMMPGSKAAIGGNCPVRASAQEAGDAPTSIRAHGGHHFEADLRGLSALELDVSTEARAASTSGAQAVHLYDIAYGELRYRAKSTAPVSFHLSGKNLSRSSSLFLDIAAPEGELRLVDAGHGDWHLNADYTTTGLISLTFPEGPDFSKMSFPAIRGRAQSLEISGCFDQVLLISGEELTRRMEGCSKMGEVDIALPDDGAIRTLALLRRGQTARLRLGPGALEISQIKIRRRPE